MNLINEIKKLKEKKNAIILAHYYQEAEIQDVADYVGDSLYLAQMAEKNLADIIVLCGVYFMAETAKILNPGKKVLIPDKAAGCSLADSCEMEDFKKFKRKYPDYKVISYINTSAEIKALSDVICTSSNAKIVVNSFPKDEKLIFAPDKNLGNFINENTGRNMVLWNGACHVHEQFSLKKILELKKNNIDAKIIAHPECKKHILMIADFIGSTASLLKYISKDVAVKYIVATESGILHQMRKAEPTKIFIAAPSEDSTCGCSECNFMKLITLPKLHKCLIDEDPEVIVKEDLRLRAYGPVKKMLDLSGT
jgi:quinolinate synthase